MKLSDGVEWAVHAAMLLGTLPPGRRLSGKALADFHGVPESYLLKHLKALAAAGILESATGPNGGYALARPAADVTLLDIVLAVEGDAPAFRCTEIRRRGPCGLDDSAYPKLCGINRAMLRAEQAYKSALAEVTLKSLTAEFTADADPRIVPLGVAWLTDNVRSPSS